MAVVQLQHHLAVVLLQHQLAVVQLQLHRADAALQQRTLVAVVHQQHELFNDVFGFQTSLLKKFLTRPTLRNNRKSSTATL